MRYVFIIQGEGRGHLTQAISIEKLLLGAGHEVVAMLVGKSPSRSLPEFFRAAVKAPVEQFESFNFVPSSSNRRPSIVKTGLYNFFNMAALMPSGRLISRKLKEIRPDVVVNFYDILGTLGYRLSRLDVPMVTLGHQFVFTHPEFKFPAIGYAGHRALNQFSNAISRKSSKILALSFRPMPSAGRIRVVPPILRPQVLEYRSPAQASTSSPLISDRGHIHGYLLNAGFAQEVRLWHSRHPEVPLRFFWDQETESVDETLSFFALDDRAFLEGLSSCHAYASTAGFESICEAMFLGKPLLMVPSHIEQKCNAYDACHVITEPSSPVADSFVAPRPACTSDRFDLDLLLHFVENEYSPDPHFVSWVRSAKEIFLRELTEF